MPVPTFAEWCIYADALKMLRIFIEGRCAYKNKLNFFRKSFFKYVLYYVACHHHQAETNQVRTIRTEHCADTVYDMWPMGQVILQGGPHLSCTIHTGSDKDGPYAFFFPPGNPVLAEFYRLSICICITCIAG